MDTAFIVEMCAFAAAAIFYSAMLLTQKGRRQKVLQKAGELLYPLSAPAKSKTAAAIFAIPCAMAAALAVNYSAAFVVLVCAVCSLAIFIVCKEDAVSANTGIYKNALLAGGSFIPWNEITDIKRGQFLEIELFNKKKMQIQTANEEESEQVLKALETARAASDRIAGARKSAVE